MSRPLYTVLAVALLTATQALGQQAPSTAPWKITLALDGYILPDDGYVNPNIAADHGWLHLEARYNYEDLRTGSLWTGYNFHAGKILVVNVTPMIGGVFGRTAGVAPGCEASLSYKKLGLSISNEYVFDVGDTSKSFYYSWPELTYSANNWLTVGLVAQHTKQSQVEGEIQGGFLVGFHHKKAEFTVYLFNVGWAEPSAILEVGWSF